MDGVVVKCVSGHIGPTKGSAGLQTQVPGGITSVSNLASATGGIAPGNVAQSDVK